MRCWRPNRTHVIGLAVAALLSLAVLFTMSAKSGWEYVTPAEKISAIQGYNERGAPAVNILGKRCHLTNAERVARVKTWCDNLETKKTLVDRSDLNAIYVNDEHKVIYCHIPKTGCTNWKKYFILLSGKTHYSRVAEILGMNAHSALFNDTVRTLSSYSPDEILRILKGYFKFVVVRHPLTRLLSAYRNKFEKLNPVFNVTSHKILIYNNHSEAEALRMRPSFEEFLRYISEPDGHHLPDNPHWMTYQELCLPCAVRYDYIAQLENMATDSRFILSRINSTYRFPEQDSTSDGFMESFYAQLPVNLVERVKLKYSDDIKAFGYDC